MKSRRHDMNGTDHQGEPQGSPFLFAPYPSAAYAQSVEPTPAADNPQSVPAALTQKPSASNRRKTSGAFGKPKHLRLMRPPTFAANAVPKETDALAEYIAESQGWEKK